MGGFELGIANSNIDAECIGWSEIDSYAASIYARHFPEHKYIGDATKIRTEDLEDFDLLVGGFPCQAFSVAGHRKGFEDTRGTLFFEIARILKDKRPRYFLLENVRGLLSHDKGKTFQTILEVLTDMGYSVRWNLLNSKDFGVPQRRERVFIEGYFRGGSGREILSLGRNDEENISGLNTGRINKVGNISPNKPHQSGDVYGTDGLARCLTSTDSQHPHLIKEDADDVEREKVDSFE